MTFWDRFIWALSFGLAQHLPVGQASARRILDMAIDQGWLTLGGVNCTPLNDASLLLLLALLPDDSPHRPQVENRVTAIECGRDPAFLIALLQTVAPPRLTEVLEIYRSSEDHLRALAFNAVLVANSCWVPSNLRLYLSRRFLSDPESQILLDCVGDLLGKMPDIMPRSIRGRIPTT